MNSDSGHLGFYFEKYRELMNLDNLKKPEIKNISKYTIKDLQKIFKNCNNDILYKWGLKFCNPLNY